MTRSTSARIIFYEFSFPETFPWFPSLLGYKTARQKSAFGSCSGVKCEVKSFRCFCCYITLKSFKLHTYLLCLHHLQRKNKVNWRLISINQNTWKFFNKGQRNAQIPEQLDLCFRSIWIRRCTISAWSGWATSLSVFSSNDAISILPCEGEYQRPGLRWHLSLTPPPVSACVASESSLEARTTWLSQRGNSPNDMLRWPRSLLNDREVQFKPLPEVFCFFVFFTVKQAEGWR